MSPYKKEVIPIARFLCGSEKQTFSLLPYQLVPYHQYTVDAIISTLISVYHFQTLGQQGYHRACLDLDPECLVSPYLIHTWATLILTGFICTHPVLNEKYPLSGAARLSNDTVIKTILRYILCISFKASPHHRYVLACVRYVADRTGRFLFGTPSGNRIRSP